jgi:hypothetical protein
MAVTIRYADQTLRPDPEIPAEAGAEPLRPGCSHIRIKGRAVSVPAVEIDGRTVISTGRWLKIAVVREEELVEGDTINDPDSFVAQLKVSGLRADLFTFAQRLPDVAPRHSYHIEWDNAAVLPIATYSEWWKERTEYSIRKGVNKAKRLGVVAKVAEFDGQFAEGIWRNYNETPVRQGRAFWHYGQDLESTKSELGTYLDRSVFIGAYYEGELIGSLKLTYVGPTATIMHILSAQKHFDKRPNNALIAKAVEVCEVAGKTHLIYGSFVYYDPNSSLTEFKRRNGFEQVLLPRYYVPLTLKGRVALSLRLQRGLKGNIPQPVFAGLLKTRSRWYAWRAKATKE